MGHIWTLPKDQEKIPASSIFIEEGVLLIPPCQIDWDRHFRHSIGTHTLELQELLTFIQIIHLKFISGVWFSLGIHRDTHSRGIHRASTQPSLRFSRGDSVAHYGISTDINRKQGGEQPNPIHDPLSSMFVIPA